MKKTKEEVNIYITSDGKKFLDLEEAKHHEFLMKMKEIKSNLTKSISYWYKIRNPEISEGKIEESLLSAFKRGICGIIPPNTVYQASEIIIDILRKDPLILYSLLKAQEVIDEALKIE